MYVAYEALFHKISENVQHILRIYEGVIESNSSILFVRRNRLSGMN
jgi:hypothetical protein